VLHPPCDPQHRNKIGKHGMKLRSDPQQKPQQVGNAGATDPDLWHQANEGNEELVWRWNGARLEVGGCGWSGWTRLDLVGLGWTSEGRVLGVGGNGMVE